MSNKKTNIILEYSEFNTTYFGTQIPMSVDNPAMSANAFSRHEDDIKTVITRLSTISSDLSNSKDYAMLRSRLSLEDQQITSLTLIRMIKDSTTKYNAFIKYNVGDEEYWGVVRNILDESPTFTSEIFKDQNLYQSKEWKIRIKGTIIKEIKKWLTPEDGEYKLINDEVNCVSLTTGGLHIIKKGIEVQVVRSHDNTIIIKHNHEYYRLSGDNYVYFNYWFEKIETPS